MKKRSKVHAAATKSQRSKTSNIDNLWKKIRKLEAVEQELLKQLATPPATPSATPSEESPYTVEIWKSKRGRQSWWARIMHKNGKQIWKTSESYATRQSLTRTINRFAKAANMEVVEVEPR